MAAALAPSLAVLFVVLAVAGVANAVAQPAINLFVAEQIPGHRQGLGFGVKQSGIPAAILVSGLALPLLALPFGWRPTFALCALAPLAVGMALPRTRGAHVSRRPASRRPSRALILTAIGAALGTAGPTRSARTSWRRRWTSESARAPPVCSRHWEAGSAWRCA